LPVQVQWESIAYFTDDSIIIPTEQQISNVLQQSLDTPEDYLGILSDLSSANPFSTTIEAYFGIPRDPSPSDSPNTSTTRSSAGGMSGIIGAAVGLTLVLAGFVLYQSLKDENEDEMIDGIQKLTSASGDATVAGDTFAGETHDGSASTSRDDDDGQQSYAQEGPITNHKSPKWWRRVSLSSKSQSEISEEAMEDFDEFVGHDAQNEIGSMSSVLSEALASYPETDQTDYACQSSAEPLDSTLRKLKQQIDEMKLGMDEKDNRRPKTVAEIESLLAKA
jgi:hypothetical protein